MKHAVSVICLLMLFSCKYNSPNEKTVTELIEITKEDLDIYEKLNAYIYEDVETIRAIADKLIPVYVDKTFLITNSYYLSKIDSAKYDELMKILKESDAFEDYIEVSAEGIVKYRIKSGIYNDFFHIHELVYVGNAPSFHPKYEYMISNSSISKSWKYIYYKTPEN